MKAFGTTTDPLPVENGREKLRPCFPVPMQVVVMHCLHNREAVPLFVKYSKEKLYVDSDDSRAFRKRCT